MNETTGILNINKPRGISSNQAVQRIRTYLNKVKAGYAGTLDPDAMGVLPVCLGKATKIVNFILEGKKEYKVTMHLGIRTDTQDATGIVIKKSSEKLPGLDKVSTVLKSFVGEIKQVPPMHSALHYRGKRMYQLARQGIEIERAPRIVNVYDIHDIRINGEYAHFVVECSKGTYIRTLCDDVGEKLGCGAHLKELIRARSGVFSIDDSLELDKIPKLVASNKLETYLYPINNVLDNLPVVSVLDQYRYHVLNGNSIPVAWLKQALPEPVSGSIRVLDGSGNLVAIGKLQGKNTPGKLGNKWIKITKVLIQ